MAVVGAHGVVAPRRGQRARLLRFAAGEAVGRIAAGLPPERLPGPERDFLGVDVHANEDRIVPGDRGTALGLPKRRCFFRRHLERIKQAQRTVEISTARVSADVDLGGDFRRRRRPDVAAAGRIDQHARRPGVRRRVDGVGRARNALPQWLRRQPGCLDQQEYRLGFDRPDRKFIDGAVLPAGPGRPCLIEILQACALIVPECRAARPGLRRNDEGRCFRIELVLRDGVAAGGDCRRRRSQGRTVMKLEGRHETDSRGRGCSSA